MFAADGSMITTPDCKGNGCPRDNEVGNVDVAGNAAEGDEREERSSVAIRRDLLKTAYVRRLKVKGWVALVPSFACQTIKQNIHTKLI